MNRKCGESVTTDDSRTFTKVLGADEDILYRDQTLGNKKKDARFDYKSGFYLCKEKRICCIYVTSVMIIISIMFLHKQRTLSAIIFLFLPLVLLLLCVYYIRMLCTSVCVVSNNAVSDECNAFLVFICASPPLSPPPPSSPPPPHPPPPPPSHPRDDMRLPNITGILQ